MVAEILKHDDLVLVGKPAWHGLGKVIDKAVRPRQALTMIGADNMTERRELFFYDSFGNQHTVHGSVINIREVPNDSPIQHGVVSSNYQIFQNIEVADFCEALRDEGKGEVTCETVGTIRNGGVIWFLLHTDAFEVGNGDVIHPYVLVSNGHDGGTTFRVTPTTVRAVCSNTLHQVIPWMDTGELGTSAINIRHTVNLMERVEEARRALKHYNTVLEQNRKMMDAMSKTQVSTEALTKFFAECYQRDFQEIPTNPQNKVEQNRADRAASAYKLFNRRFDDEVVIAGASWWNAFNAYSGLIQHDLKARGKDDADRVERRIDSNLFGLGQWRTQEALKIAFKASLSA